MNFNDNVAEFRAKQLNTYSSFASWEKLERIAHKAEEQFYFIFFVMTILISEVQMYFSGTGFSVQNSAVECDS